MKKIVIIGGGLGGLTSGALLAKAGFRVTLLEQHSIVGGCATVFKRGDFTCEVGLHEMDGLGERDSKVKIFNELGIFDSVDFVKIPQFFRAKLDDLDITIPHGIENVKRVLKEQFPKESIGIDNYFTKIDSISKSIHELSNLKKFINICKLPKNILNIVLNSKQNFGSFLDSIIKDEKLKTVLNSNLGYYHDDPYSLSLIYHAIPQYSYFEGGSWFIKGGSQNLSDALADIIIENGGDVIKRAKVTALKTKDSKITKVLFERKKESFELESDAVISNTSPQQTYSMLDRKFYDEKIDKLEIAPSLFTIYLGFNKNLKNIYPDNPYSSFFIENVEKQSDLNSKNIELKERVFSFVDYSKIDSGLTKNDKSFGVLCGIDYIDEWENLSKDEYRAKKDEIKESFLNRLEKHYPDIRNYIEYSELATAKTVKRYTLSESGTAYGFAQTPKQIINGFKIKSKKVKNLYFAGSWSEPASGFTGAIISGDMTSKKVKQDIC